MKTLSKFKIIFAVIAFASLTFSCEDEATELNTSLNDVDLTTIGIIKGNPIYSELVRAIELAELTETLKSKEPYTLFAPNNAAFATATGTGGWASSATSAQVTKVLQYHLTTVGNVRSNQLTNNQVIAMATSPAQNTTAILGTGTVDIRDTVNSLSRVNQADVQASNVVIHRVSKVLQPAL